MSTEQAEKGRFTLVEVIVVVVILLVLLAFLLMNINSIQRESYSRTACQNNLRELSLATINYSTTRKGRLPTGTIVHSAKEPAERLSFLVTLLPYLEQEQVYKSLDLNQGWGSAVNQPLVDQSINLYLCPAGRSRGPGFLKVTNYVGLTGVGSDSATLDGKHARAGAFGYDRVTNFSSSFENGASQTLLLIETTKENGPWAAGGAPTLRGVPEADPAPIKEGGAFGVVHSTSGWGWGKPKATANVAFGDGSVQVIDADVDPKVLAAMATANGGR
jgi:prepilin-type processing-associated H-X9-DG protein